MYVESLIGWFPNTSLLKYVDFGLLFVIHQLRMNKISRIEKCDMY